jgi:hypothetical protein
MLTWASAYLDVDLGNLSSVPETSIPITIIPYKMCKSNFKAFYGDQLHVG